MDETTRLQRRLLFFAILGIVVTGVVVGLLTGRNLYRAAQDEADDGLRFAAYAEAWSLRESLTDLRDLAAGVAGYTRLKQALAQYNHNRISSERLVELSAPALGEAIGFASPIAGITRLDARGDDLLSVGLPIPKRLWPEGVEQGALGIAGPIEVRGRWYLVAVVPITERRAGRIGTDLVAFPVASVVNVLSDGVAIEQATETLVTRTVEGSPEVLFWQHSDGVSVGSQARDAHVQRLLRASVEAEAGLRQAHDEGSDWVLAQVPIWRSNWTLWVRVDAHRLYAGARATVLTTAAAIALLVIAFTLITLAIMRPLARRAVATAQQMRHEVRERTQAEQALRVSEDQLKRQAEDLARSNRDLEQFAYIASHDLQEPLRMISGYTQLLARRYGERLGEPAGEFMGYVIDGVKRMQTLVNELLSYSRVGTREMALGTVDLEEVLQHVLRELGERIVDSGAEVTHAPLPRVSGAESALGQLLGNLIGNALKYRGAAPPRVHIGAEPRDDGLWTLSVRDNGIGFDPQYEQRIFQIFQRLHTSAEYTGTGIGLALCRRIVERHGGELWAESTPGAGATFYFTLPVAETDQNVVAA